MEPSVATAMNGSRAVLVLSVDEPAAFTDGLQAFCVPVRVSPKPRGTDCWVRLDLSWEWEKQCNPAPFDDLGYNYFRNMPLDKALEEYVLIGIGEYLEKGRIVPPEDENVYAAQISLREHLMAISKRQPAASDDEILSYWGAKMYHSSAYRIEDPRLRASDLFRLRTGFNDFRKVTGRYEPKYWEPVTQDGIYKYTLDLLRDFERGVLAFNRPAGPIFQVRHFLVDPPFGVAQRHHTRCLESLEEEPAKLTEACREAILALESVAKTLTGLESATLGDCVKKLRSEKQLGRPLDLALDAISGFRGSAPGVMHAGGRRLEELDRNELQYVINLASASMVFLVSLERN